MKHAQKRTKTSRWWRKRSLEVVEEKSLEVVEEKEPKSNEGKKKSLKVEEKKHGDGGGKRAKK